MTLHGKCTLQDNRCKCVCVLFVLCVCVCVCVCSAVALMQVIACVKLNMQTSGGLLHDTARKVHFAWMHGKCNLHECKIKEASVCVCVCACACACACVCVRVCVCSVVS